ncbi:hypothetical protein QTP88_006197 [Uroleucon formosanum]
MLKERHEHRRHHLLEQMTSFLQINVGVGRAAQDLALATASMQGIDIVIISEQNRNRPEEEGWYSDSAVVALNRIPIFRVGPLEQGFRWIEVPGFRVYSCYCKPNCAISDFNDFLHRLEHSIRTAQGPVIVAGDFNAKSYLWGIPIEDARSTLLADLTAALDMFACNAGASPTFVRGQSKSHIDITFASSRIRGTVSDEESLSLHRYIKFEVGTYISTMTQPCHGKRARLGEDHCQVYEKTWKNSRKKLAIAIKEAKERCWSDLIPTIDKDPWGKPYKIVMKRLRKQRPIPGMQLPGRMDTITDTLFPTVPRLTHPTSNCTNLEPPVLFSMHELITAVRSLPNGKVSGPDGLSNEIIKVAVSVDTSRFLHTYNACLASGKFPDF